MSRASSRRRPGSASSPILGFPIFARPGPFSSVTRPIPQSAQPHESGDPGAAPAVPNETHPAIPPPTALALGPRFRGDERRGELPASPAKAGAHPLRDGTVAWTPASAGETVWVDWVNLDD
jgi:hypothetical protein